MVAFDLQRKYICQFENLKYSPLVHGLFLTRRQKRSKIDSFCLYAMQAQSIFHVFLVLIFAIRIAILTLFTLFLIDEVTDGVEYLLHTVDITI